MILHFSVRDSAFFAYEILRDCGIAGGFESLKRGRLYFWRKPKVAKTFKILLRTNFFN